METRGWMKTYHDGSTTVTDNPHTAHRWKVHTPDAVTELVARSDAEAEIEDRQERLTACQQEATKWIERAQSLENQLATANERAAKEKEANAVLHHNIRHFEEQRDKAVHDAEVADAAARSYEAERDQYKQDAERWRATERRICSEGGIQDANGSPLVGYYVELPEGQDTFAEAIDSAIAAEKKTGKGGE